VFSSDLAGLKWDPILPACDVTESMGSSSLHVTEAADSPGGYECINRVFHPNVTSTALYILLPNESNRCIGETFIIAIHRIMCSALGSIWRKTDVF
jgi:hypothetical protein